jgi:uridine phosphorylase
MMERDVAMAVAATAAAMSPRAREFVRKGAVYGLAGMLRAGDVVVGTAKGAARGAQEGFSADGQSARRSQPRARQKAAR